MCQSPFAGTSLLAAPNTGAVWRMSTQPWPAAGRETVRPKARKAATVRNGRKRLDIMNPLESRGAFYSKEPVLTAGTARCPRGGWTRIPSGWKVTRRGSSATKKSRRLSGRRRSFGRPQSAGS